MLTDTVEQSKLKSQRTHALVNARTVCFVVGAFLLAVAFFVQSDSYSQVLSGGNKDLTWGPVLFRSLLAFHGVVIAVLGAFWTKPPARSDVVSIDQRLDSKVLSVLIALTVAALVLRLWSLNSAPWIDEVLTLVDFVRLPINEIVISFPSQNQHMLYSVLARGAFALFGESIWALRLPAVMFGIGSIWALFFFARHVIGTREALLACAIMTVSYHHVWFSQNARGYTGLLMMSLLATWTWLEALRSNTWRWWALYGVAVVGGMLIHMTMAFVVATHGIVYLMFLVWPRLSGDDGHGSAERRAGLKPFVAWLLSATVTLQLYALALPQFLATGLHEESRNSEWTNPIWVLTESIENLSIGFAGTAVVVVAAAFVIFGWISIFIRNRRAALLMVLPPALSGGLMLALGHNLFPRFFFFAMGFALLIVVHGTLELPRIILGSMSRFHNLARFAPKLGVGFALLIVVASLFTVPRNYAMPKQDFAGARDYVRENLTQSSRAVAVNIAGDMFAKYYAPDWVTTRDVSQLNQLERGNETVWLVYTMPFEIQAFTPELWKAIQDDYEIVRTFPGTLNGGEVVVCRQRRTLVKK
jgi:mannosyltransferase